MLDRQPEPWPVRPYQEVFEERIKRLRMLRRSPDLWKGAIEYYRTRPINFINDWGITFDPRLAGTGVPPFMPFILFKRQRELVEFFYSCLGSLTSGLIEKSRDMGATWTCAAISVHLWRFWDGASIGWGSRKAQQVDNIGDPSSIFEKIRILIRALPQELHPDGFSLRDHMSYMRIINPDNGATIVGEAGDDIGRGGRSLVAVKDESAHYEHPEMIEAALMANAAVQMDISSVPVHSTGTIFQRRREEGVEWVPGMTMTPGKVHCFIMDWRDHPAKNQEWHDATQARMVGEGLGHVFAAEIERDYSAAVQGTIIPAAWVRSAIDAHIKLNFMCQGPWVAALDVADAGFDTNALVTRQGVVLRSVEEWGERDTGVTTRRAIAACTPLCPVRLQYDAVGVGSSVKAESNRLNDEKLLPRGLRLVPWNAGAAPQDPERRVIPDDRDSPLNKDFYQNLKAQGWWMLRKRFELTHRAVTLAAKELPVRDTREEFTWDEEDLISLPSNLGPLLWKLVKELSQPTIKYSSNLKMTIDKTPEGVPSPNLGDAVMMAYWPIKAGGMFDIPDAALRRAAIPMRRH